MNDPLLNISNLKIISENPNRTLIQDFSLKLKQQRSIALIGESGSGKTTVIKAILGFLPNNCRITEGSILLNSTTDLAKIPQKEFYKIRGKKIVTILQNAMGSLTPSMRIGKQIIETLRQHHTLSKKEAFEKAEELLASVHIPDPKRCLYQYPFELSGGMRQRVVIAIALSCSPELILADEPTTALDSVSQAQVLKILHQVHKQNQSAMILVTHNLALVTELCDDIVIIKNGKIIEIGSVQDIFSYPQHPYTKQLLNAVSRIPITENMTPILRYKPHCYATQG
ncbi:ABC transporter ATP-binding protein [Chlamydia pecorum]|uniref:ABC transporter family protein n=1 Tax=Chlamydia pecorum TaxID=85991 RepID=A0AA40PPP9_9CHLA|nr:ABC transporter ATP-binding protein [Chlamydia pecorum]AGW38065.1 peptide ABC transporter, ATP-binding protein [Chlamydia pecorum PV3056/3]ETF37082.1 peptide ABC transporter ATP-binding protein [Chlamydia pecorum MC/MarsBar]ETF37232.1 peptide ABC transporter ATP-binding protein [Chlamydia pecorum DBDeUG]KTF28404.1 ABC transporter family protein [Chlamydia pecorum]KZN27096.1 ABC transporter family protein [Chlamydia pecorum]